MKKFLISTIGGFLINNAVATAVAMALLNPLLDHHFKGTVRTMEQGLNLVALLSGYFLLTLLMVWLYPKIEWKKGWLSNGLTFGMATGGFVFVSGHLIVAGWSVISAFPMFVSGVLDCLTTMASGVFIAFVYRNGST